MREKGWNMWKYVRVRGSYTLEAVFLFPMIVFLLAFMLQLSIGWYENIQEASENVDEVCLLETRKYFLDIGELKAVKDILLP